MQEDQCGPVPLFRDSIEEPFIRLLEKLFDTVDIAAVDSLQGYREFGKPYAGDLHRLLGEVVIQAIPQIFTARAMVPFLRAVNGALPCNSAELGARLANAGIRPVEEDLMFVVLYGFKRGLSPADIERIPFQSVTLGLRVDPELTMASLSDLQPVWEEPRSDATFFSAARTEKIFLDAAGVHEVSAVTVPPWLITLLTLGIPELIGCLKDLFTGDKAAPGTWQQQVLAYLQKALDEINKKLKDNDERRRELNKQPASDDRKRELDKLDAEDKILNEDKDKITAAMTDINKLPPDSPPPTLPPPSPK
jgi:hypothetical protein